MVKADGVINGYGTDKRTGTDVVNGCGADKRMGTDVVNGYGTDKRTGTDVVNGYGTDKRMGTDVVNGCGADKRMGTDAIRCDPLVRFQSVDSHPCSVQLCAPLSHGTIFPDFRSLDTSIGTFALFASLRWILSFRHARHLWNS